MSGSLIPHGTEQVANRPSSCRQHGSQQQDQKSMIRGSRKHGPKHGQHRHCASWEVHGCQPSMGARCSLITSYLDSNFTTKGRISPPLYRRKIKTAKVELRLRCVVPPDPARWPDMLFLFVGSQACSPASFPRSVTLP